MESIEKKIEKEFSKEELDWIQEAARELHSEFHSCDTPKECVAYFKEMLKGALKKGKKIGFKAGQESRKEILKGMSWIVDKKGNYYKPDEWEDLKKGRKVES